MKLTIVHIKAKNICNKTQELYKLWNFTLLTKAGRIYEQAGLMDLQSIFMPSEDVKTKAVKCMPYYLYSFTNVAPTTVAEFDVVFQTLQQEEASELQFKVGRIEGIERKVIVKL